MMTDPLIMFQGGDPNDLRFQFKVIEGLSESIRQQSTSTERLASAMADMQKTQVGMLERLATLEASKFSASIADLEADVAALKAEKQRRDGAAGAFGAIKDWSPFIAAVMATLAAAWLYGRSIGLTPAPPTAPTRVEATVHPEERRIEGVVGGKP